MNKTAILGFILILILSFIGFELYSLVTIQKADLQRNLIVNKRVDCNNILNTEVSKEIDATNCRNPLSKIEQLFGW